MKKTWLWAAAGKLVWGGRRRTSSLCSPNPWPFFLSTGSTLCSLKCEFKGRQEAVRRARRRDRRVSWDLGGRLLHCPYATPAHTNAGTLQAFHCLCSPLSISWAFGSRSLYDGVKGNQQPRLPSSMEMLWNFQRTQLFPHIPVLICTDSALDALHCKWCMKWNLLARLMQRRKAL